MERALEGQRRAEVAGLRRGEARAVNNQGVIQRRTGRLGDALGSFSRARSIYDDIGDDAAVAQSLNNLSVVLGFDLGSFDRALAAQLEALAIRERLGDPQDLYQSYNTLGVLYDNLDDHDASIAFLERALEGWRSLDLSPRIAATLSNLAGVYTQEDSLQKALDLQTEALAIRQELGNASGIAVSLENIGSILTSMGRYPEARRQLERSLVMREEMGELKNTASSLLNLAALERLLGRFEEAGANVDRALDIARQIEASDVERSAYLELSRLRERWGDPAGALEAFRRWDELDDSLSSEARGRYVAALEAEYQAERSRREIARLTSEASLARATAERRGAAIVVGFLLALVAFLLYRRRAATQLQRRLAWEVEARTAELTRANDRLQEISLTDTLTGLRNRRYLFESIEGDLAVSLRAHREALESGTAADASDVVFYVLDMDDFKSVNDEYGHAAGDQVLVQVARVLEDAGRASDVVIRWGGEEFLILSRQVDRAGAAVFAQRVRERISRTEFGAGGGVPIRRTCSVGFAPYPLLPDRPEFGSWEQVVGLADAAAYLAKRSGRDAWVGISMESPELRPGRPMDMEVIQAAVEDGALRLTTSLDAEGRELCWNGAE
jgi:diguanylate cyclase (GGDEF)-like protein